MRRYLLTGGAGFIGMHLARHLLKRGDAVTVLDDLSGGSPVPLPQNAESERLTLVTGDLREADILGAALAGVAGVFHLAARISPLAYEDDPIGAHEINLGGTLRLFEAVRRAGCLPVVYASSAAVYGDIGPRPAHEAMQVRPLSAYGADKLACEVHACALWQSDGLPSLGLRLFNVYGPGQSPDAPYAGVLTRFAANLRAGRPHEIHGDGAQRRDFVHVDDAVRAFCGAMARLERTPGASVVNVCTGRSVSILDAAGLLDGLVSGNRPALRWGAARKADIRHSQGDTSRMAETLGLGRTLPLEDGLTSLLASTESALRVS